MAAEPRGRLVLDARILHYNRSGIAHYIRHLYGALAALAGAGEAAPDLTVLYHRRDSQRALGQCWRPATAWTPAHHPLERWTLAAEVARLRPALLHSPDHVCPQPLGWRAVVTVHDLAFWLLPQTHALDSRAYYDGVRRSVRQASRVICVSEHTRQDLLRLTEADPARLRVVYEAPGPAYTSHGPAASGPRPYFVFLGSVEPRKNAAAVIRALARLPQAARPELRLIGAPGPAQRGVEALVVALGVEDSVRWLGRLDDDAVAVQLRGAAGLVFPSLLEGFGLPILEAMACGAPVITANRSSMAEIGTGAAELVEPEDPAALAGAMQRLLDDGRHRDELRRLGLARAAQFSWQRAARETLAVFDEALREAA